MIRYLLPLSFLFACTAPVTSTVGDTCESLAETLCTRLLSCAGGVSPECEAIVYGECCTGAECGERYEDEADLAADLECIEAYETFSCELLLAGNAPSECL